MNDTIAPESALEALTPAQRASYARATAKIADPTAKPLTEKEHEAYDLVHGPRASLGFAPPSAPVADPMTPEERDAIAREAQREIPPEDPALFARDGRGSAGMTVHEDRYELDERGVSAESLAAARFGQHTDEQVHSRASDLAARGVWDNPPPIEAQRPSAALPGDPNAPAGAIVENDMRTSTRPRVDSIELAQEYDELDHLIGSGHRRSQASFDFLRDSRTEHRHVFSRHYYDKGVLVDRYAGTGERIETEVADKIRKITAYNLTVPREQQLGYLAYAAGVDLSFDDVAPALERQIASKIVVPAEKGGGEAMAPDIVHNMSSLQIRPAAGFARILEKPIPLPDGRSPMGVFFHDAMKGIYQLHVDGITVEARNREAAESAAREKLAATAVAATASATAV